MSDNVRDELAELPPTRAISRIVRSIRYPLLGSRAGVEALAHLAERGMVVFGPDGEPLDVRPALRALKGFADYRYDMTLGDRHESLEQFGITGPLTEVEP